MGMDGQDLTGKGVVLVNDISTSGYTSAYKHAGPNPKRPLVVGYNGSSEVSLFDKDRVVGTTPSVFMKVVPTNGADPEDLINKNKNDLSHVTVYIGDEDINIFIKDIYAPLAQNRTLQVKQ
jgi:hypothetical protein